MNLQRKIELARQAIQSVATHEDEDAAVRAAALARIEAEIAAAKSQMDARVSARITEQIGA